MVVTSSVQEHEANCVTEMNEGKREGVHPGVLVLESLCLTAEYKDND